jgi:ribose-phosphate pyrophosphokinase
VLSGGAVAGITASKLNKLVISHSIQPGEAIRAGHNIRVLSIATLIGGAIGATAEGGVGIEPRVGSAYSWSGRK